MREEGQEHHLPDQANEEEMGHAAGPQVSEGLDHPGDRPQEGRLEPLTFLDLDYAIVNRVLQREREQRRSGPIAEAILREIGVVAAKIG